MKTKGKLLALLLAISLIGCGKQPEPRHIVILPDVSGSIDREALKQAFKAIDEMVSHLHRGDRIAIIPILGDAQAEASGRIIRYALPNSRQAYDSDLRDFRARLQKSLAEMEAAAIAHPGARTDILGSIALAEQEFQTAPSKPKQLLVILSDFIQEDKSANFKTDARLVDQVSAKKFAALMAMKSSLAPEGTFIYMGMLRSSEYASMRIQRREAIQQFWTEYGARLHAQTFFVTDGPGLLTNLASCCEALLPPISPIKSIN